MPTLTSNDFTKCSWKLFFVILLIQFILYCWNQMVCIWCSISYYNFFSFITSSIGDLSFTVAYIVIFSHHSEQIPAKLVSFFSNTIFVIQFVICEFVQLSMNCQWTTPPLKLDEFLVDVSIGKVFAHTKTITKQQICPIISSTKANRWTKMDNTFRCHIIFGYDFLSFFNCELFAWQKFSI